jgi:hypothetical protein
MHERYMQFDYSACNIAVDTQTSTNLYSSFGSVSGIRCFFDPWIRDGKIFGSRIRDYFMGLIFEKQVSDFGIKILEFFDADQYLGSCNPGPRKWDPRSWINIPDPQTCSFFLFNLEFCHNCYLDPVGNWIRNRNFS